MPGTLLVILTTSITWLVCRRFFRKSPLDNVPGPPPSSRLFGNIPQLVNPKGWDFHRQISERYGGVIKMRGILGERLLVISDPKALHYILVKDQDVYELATHNISRANMVWGASLTSSLGQQHRKQRRMVNPVFSTNHLRDMVPLFYEVAERVQSLASALTFLSDRPNMDQLQMVFKRKLENGSQEIDVLHWISRAALEIIGQSGMDYSFDSLVDDNDYHPYSKAVKKLPMLLSGPVGFLSARIVLPWAAKINLPRFKRFIVEHIPFRRVQELIRVIDIMYSTSIDIIEAKKKAMESPYPEVVAEMSSKKDIISILLKANATADEEDRLTDAEVIGQVSSFVFAGMDTTSTAICRILHLLAIHQNVQERLREEIVEAQKLERMDYDKLVSLPYLDAVCRETLRVCPPVPLAFTRTARQDMVLPLSKPILDSTDKEIMQVLVDNGTHILVSILAANRDPDIWGSDSYEWKPERWLRPLPKTVEEAQMPGVYSHLMTFLGGGRACIGFKFSELEIKVILSVLLTSFQISASEKVIGWRMDGITGPVVEGPDEQKKQLPLQLRLLESE